ncbi:hypothetical protein CPB84DRAFT_1762565 [Gymnopilus junonius]|uniref:TEA domain-containing protein n=1 Tax=Gymnopilus junonius TaxID=109634 RepID=A0A9P5NZR6_GYMJU|nr:hypothetical protein CPB84DRAFT_1762565 [Gymnopilus junonius]
MASSSSLESSPSSPASARHPSTESFNCTPLQNPRTQDVFQSIVNGRKSWKTLRGGEVVWPPELEAALIEGLENYQPDDSRETRLLGRFPMRNRFISDWIYEKTGKRRTAKQVGSRLQQLRDTCGGKRLLNLLSPNRRPYRAPSLTPEFQYKDGHLSYGPPSLRCGSESGSDSSASAPTTPTEAHATLQNLLYRGIEPRKEQTPNTIVYIDLLTEDSSMDSGSGLQSPLSSPSGQEAEERSWIERGCKIVRASPHPRRLRDIDPTITLMSPTVTVAQSHYTVWQDDRHVYSESTPLDLVESAATGDATLLYKTSLVPTFWETISQCSNASQYVIIQRVVEDISPSSAPSTIFSAMYRFNYASSFQTENTYAATTMMQLDTPMQKPDYGFDAMLSMDTESFHDMTMTMQKPQNYFGISYMGSDWSGSPASDSVYHSPVDDTRQISCMMGGDEQHVTPTTAFPLSDVPNYVLGP